MTEQNNKPTPNRSGPNKLAAASLVILSALLITVLAAYGLGYFLGSETVTERNKKERFFSAAWQVTLYRPAARAESAILGIPVELGWVLRGPGTIGPFEPIRCYFNDDVTPDQEVPGEDAVSEQSP